MLEDIFKITFDKAKEKKNRGSSFMFSIHHFHLDYFFYGKLHLKEVKCFLFLIIKKFNCPFEDNKVNPLHLW